MPKHGARFRSPDWIAYYGAHVGGTVWLDMPVVGEAQVLAIEPCPPLEDGEGRLVTGTFKHTSGEVYDLKLESESEPIGVTATHPFWSVDREDWVSAIDLEIGETLKTLEGTTVVESRSKREEPETVYNIEVEGDHCYRVGESGVLVHNASAGACCDPPLEEKNAKHGKRYDSGVLRQNLRDGNYGPKDGPPSAVTSPASHAEAHHLVEGNRPSPYKQKSLDILFNACIGINDAVNGVFLPKSKNNDPNPQKRIYHTYTFCTGYQKWVYDLLASTDGSTGQVKAKLGYIRGVLKSGSATWIRKGFLGWKKGQEC